MRYLLAITLLLLLTGVGYAAGLPSSGTDITTAASGSYSAILHDSTGATTISVLGTSAVLSEEIYVGNASTLGVQFYCSSDSDSVQVEMRQEKAIIGLHENNITNNSVGAMYVQPSDATVAVIDTLTIEAWSPVYTITINGEKYKRLLFTGLSANGTIANTVITAFYHIKGPK